MKLVSWNVNGVRSVLKQGPAGLFDLVNAADVVCLQETKAHPGDVAHVAWPRGYQVFWNSAAKKGYSGTAVLTRVPPLSVSNGIGLPAHDGEGRVLTLEFADFWLANVYQPNSQRGLTRLAYRTGEWDPVFRAFVKKLEKRGKPVVFCGDLNVAHTEIDLANPKTNRRNAGFTDEERANFTQLLAAGLHRYVARIRKGPGPLHVVEPDERLPSAEHRVAGRLLCREREAEARPEAGADPTQRYGQRPLSGGAGVEITSPCSDSNRFCSDRPG